MSQKKILGFTDIIGPHPVSPHPFGVHLNFTDAYSDSGVPHRHLDMAQIQKDEFVSEMKKWMIAHHISPEAMEGFQRYCESMKRQGFPVQVGHFPKNLNTQKGNWAEIFLAEYITSSTNTKLPVYRLRYNPNVNQSMKGDDVLAFDLDSNPVRVLVGEAKFRSTPSKQAVEEIVDALARSHRASIPISLHFVANRLFEQGKNDLGDKVMNCSSLFASGQIQLEYVGLLVSDNKVSEHVRKNTKTPIHRLAVMSLGLSDAEGIVSSCYEGIDN